MDELQSQPQAPPLNATAPAPATSPASPPPPRLNATYDPTNYYDTSPPAFSDFPPRSPPPPGKLNLHDLIPITAAKLFPRPARPQFNPTSPARASRRAHYQRELEGGEEGGGKGGREEEDQAVARTASKFFRPLPPTPHRDFRERAANAVMGCNRSRGGRVQGAKEESPPFV